MLGGIEGKDGGVKREMLSIGWVVGLCMVLAVWWIWFVACLFARTVRALARH